MTGVASAGEPDTGHSRAAGIARGAGVIAGLTMLARILGLVRTLVFSQTVGATCLGTAYFTANQVPNIVYELVLGGALGSAMVPVLARSAERSGADAAEKAQVSRITSALLTWTLVILVPLTLLLGLAAGPLVFGPVVQNYGYAAGFTACAAVATVLALVMVAFHSEPLLRRAGVSLPPAAPGT